MVRFYWFPFFDSTARAPISQLATDGLLRSSDGKGASMRCPMALCARNGILVLKRRIASYTIVHVIVHCSVLVELEQTGFQTY